MLVKATENFSGAVSMTIGQTRELSEGDILSDLLRAGYVEPVAPVQPSAPKEEPEQEEESAPKEEPEQEEESAPKEEPEQEEKVETKRGKQRVSK